jgi:hypothetical protein
LKGTKITTSRVRLTVQWHLKTGHMQGGRGQQQQAVLSARQQHVRAFAAANCMSRCSSQPLGVGTCCDAVLWCAVVCCVLLPRPGDVSCEEVRFHDYSLTQVRRPGMTGVLVLCWYGLKCGRQVPAASKIVTGTDAASYAVPRCLCKHA